MVPPQCCRYVTAVRTLALRELAEFFAKERERDPSAVRLPFAQRLVERIASSSKKFASSAATRCG